MQTRNLQLLANMIDNIVEKAEHILETSSHDEVLAKYIDTRLCIPHPYLGNGPVKLVVLGQDPTVKNAASRRLIKTVLNLDKKGSARSYLACVCQGLGIDLEHNVYATNLYKNFFIQPPTQIKEIDIFRTFLNKWLPLLEEELAQFAGVPVITLGEPVLTPLLKSGVPIRLREYWGYTSEWEIGQLQPLKYIRPDNNLLGRTIFPFPHQPSLRKQFYKKRMNEYIAFMKASAFAE